MANASDMNKDQFIRDYEKQRHSFIEGLKRFNSNRGTPFHRIPEISGYEVDLYHLYQRVTGYGGWQKVNNEEKWSKMLPDFGIPKACTNAHEALKHIYFRYLNNYEKVNFLGEDIDQRKNDDEEGPTRKKICLPIESVQLSYNYNQHKITDAQRQQYSLPLETSKKGPYEKLELSLQSGLPNEVDMAVNVCVLLSTEGRHTTNLQKANTLLPLLLAHVGIFGEDELKLEDLYSSTWLRHSKKDFLRFWYESVRKKDIRMLITWKGHVYTQKEMVGEEVLNMGRDLGVLDSEGQRVTQLAVLLRNLSFEECNQKVMASSKAVFKFLLLCLHNTYGNLKQLALDTLANLSHEIVMEVVESLTSRLMMNIIQEAMVSEDRFYLVRGLEVLSKICHQADNKEVVASELTDDVYTRLIDLLTLQDIQIIVHTLEALYKLSKAGEPFTTKIARVHKAIEILVSLITIEAQSFGPGSLVGIKVVEYVPPAQTTEEGGEMVKRPTTVIQLVNPDSVNIYQVPGGQAGNLKSANAAQSVHGAKDSAAIAQAKARETVTDIQATTTSWLKATYEAKKKSKVNQVELFSDYLHFCRKFGIKNNLSSADFLQMVKNIFQQCEVLSINRKNGDRDVFFEGLCKRQQQRPFVVTTVPSDKVAKAVNVNVSPQQIPPHVVTPTLRQRLMEPPRLSSQHQIPHSPGIATTGPSPVRNTVAAAATPSQALGGKSGTPNLATRKVARIISPPQPQTAKAKKRDADSNVITPLQRSGAAIPHMTNMSSPSFVPAEDGGLSHFNQNGIMSEPSSSYHSPMEESTDPSCVKSLLAKKLCQTSSDSPLEPVSLPKSSMCLPVPTTVTTTISSVMTTKPSSNSGSASSFSHAVSVMACPAVTSSQMNPGYRPVYQQGKSTVVTTESWSPQVTCPLPSFSTNQSQNQSALFSTSSSSSSSQSHLSQSSAMHASHPNQPTPLSEPSTLHNFVNNQPSANVAVVNQESNRDIKFTLNAQKSNQVTLNTGLSVAGTGAFTVVAAPQPTTTFSNAQQCVNVSMIQPSNNTSTPTLSQQQTVNVQVVQQQQQQQQQSHNVHQVANNSHSLAQTNPNVTFVQQRQNVPIIPQPSAIQPQMSNPNPVLSVQGSSTLVVGPRPTAGFVQQQQPQQCSMTSPSSITLNHLIRTPSSVQIAGQSLGNVPGAASITAANPQQCTTVTQSISSPAVAALLTSNPQQASPMLISSPVQGATRPSMGVPSTVVIQTPPGTIVMPSRQLVLQGGMGNVQQQPPSQPGTVSFVVPPNYRQTSSLIIQQAGGVNMLPSLTLQTQQPMASSLTPQAGHLAGQLGTRQILINQSGLSMGMQIASMTGNPANICVTPQQQSQPQANLVIQSIPAQSNQIQSQLPAIASQHHSSMNGTAVHLPQAVGNESQLPRSDAMPVQQNQVLQQQNCQPSAIAPQQLQNPQLVVQVSQGQQQQTLPTLMTNTQPLVPPQTVHCNGNISEVNGVLGSPDSMSSDLPPSPLSTGGMSCDKDIPNGKLTDSDKEGTTLKANLVKFVEKAAKSKVNGFVHVKENGCHIYDQSKLPPTATGVNPPQHPNTSILVKRSDVPNGCPSNVPHQPGDALFPNNVQGRVLVNNGPCANPVPQNDQPTTHTRDGPLIPMVARPQMALSKPAMSNQLRPMQQQVVTDSATPTRPQTRISTLSCPVSLNSGTAPASRTPVFRSNSEDSDISNDSADAGDRAPKLGLMSPIGLSKKKPPPKKLSEMTQPSPLPQRLRKKKGPVEAGGGAEGKTPISITLEYRCEWGPCRRTFASSRLVFLHVFRHHIPKTPESCCQWLSCETMVRKRWSLVSHVQDYHCSEMAMRNACQRRFAAIQNPSAPLPPPPPQPMVYPPDAAIQAIRRFAIKPPYQEFAEPREGPVSKHIRLTAALILRNICHHSPYGRRIICRYEQHLSFNTMNAVESSSVLSSCLWDILHFGKSEYKSSSTSTHL